MIEDEELRDIFAAEADENLTALEQGLVELEKSPQNRDRLESVFRVAHSLKGSAAMLGVASVESVAHHFEEVLDRARRGQAPFSSGAADQLYQALDALRGLVREAVEGVSAGVDLRGLLEALKQPPKAQSAPAREPAATAAPQPEPVEVAASPAVEPEPEPQETTRPLPATPTIRVEVQRLEDALEKVGELIVTSARIGLRRGDVLALQDMHEDWLRDWRNRSSVVETEAWQRDGLRLAVWGERLETLLRNLEDDQARLQHTTETLRDSLQELRLLPVAGLLNMFPRLVRDLAQTQGKEIELSLSGADTTADRRLIEGLKDPLTHLLRNAVDHGIEMPDTRLGFHKPRQARIGIAASREGSTLQLVVSDDGGGIDLTAVRRRALEHGLLNADNETTLSDPEVAQLIFAPGFSTRSEVSQVSGRGTGLDAVRTQIEALGGSVGLEFQAGAGTTFRLRLPLTVTTTQVLVCREDEQLYALPLSHVERTLTLSRDEIQLMDGRPVLNLDHHPVPLVSLARVLGCEAQEEPYAVLLRDAHHRFGLTVRHLVGVMELMVKPFSESPFLQGVSILPDGGICLVLTPGELQRSLARIDVAPNWDETRPVGLRILLAEDSASMRNFERRILEGAGYRVTAVVDGQEAWERVQREAFDAVISDIEMPRMSGLELTRRIRRMPRFADLPVLLVTSLASDSDRRAGMEAGANAYLAKSEFEAGRLLRFLERIL